MKKIIKVVSVEKRVNGSGKAFVLTTAILEDGETYVGAASEPFVEDEYCEAWFDDRWQKPKMRKPSEKEVK